MCVRACVRECARAFYAKVGLSLFARGDPGQDSHSSRTPQLAVSKDDAAGVAVARSVPVDAEAEKGESEEIPESDADADADAADEDEEQDAVLLRIRREGFTATLRVGGHGRGCNMMTPGRKRSARARTFNATFL